MARRFRGSEEVRVDAKGRISIPAKFRRVFESCDPDWETGRRPQLVIVYGRDDWRHLELYTIEAIEEIDAQIDLMQRGSPERRLLESIMHGAAEEAEIDPDGRLLLPQKLREKIGLDDRAFFIASGDYLKLWRPEAYAEAEGDAVEALVASFEPGFDPRSLLPPRRPASRSAED
ncbi:MAG TPA: division/cell wall cluster transcriptional repressor MraZ [Paracoccus sp. (in: a-proteobacteria)]|nr:division/cell wall cluster transcriptional repressor MraZ [Paracoccus sp. (in: a-proteobacteria)]